MRDEVYREHVRRQAEMIIAISKGGVSPELEEVEEALQALCARAQ
jgi:hypothetical protein